MGDRRLIVTTDSPPGLPRTGSTFLRFLPILLVQLMGTLGYSIAIPFLVFLVRDLGGAPWTYGVVGATYSACQLVGAPILGRWSDRSGRVPILVISQAGTFLAWALFGVALMLPAEPLGAWGGAVFTVPLGLVFVARALDGLTGGNVSVANAYVADLTSQDSTARGVAFGQMGIAASLGFVLGPALAGLLGSLADGYLPPVIAAAAISALALMLCLALKEPVGRCPVGPDEPPAVARVLGQQHRRCDRLEPALALASTVGSRRLHVFGLLVATFLQFLAFNLFYAGFPVHADLAYGWTAGGLGFFFMVLSGVMICAQGPLLNFASRYVASARIFLFGMLCLTAAFVVFAADHAWAPYVGAVSFAVGNGLAWPTFQARLADVAGPDQGAVQGAATSAGSLASIFGLIVGGVLYPYLTTHLFTAGAVIFLLVGAATPLWFAKIER